MTKSRLLQLDCWLFNCTFGPLKISVYIASIYLLFLCCYPCVEGNCRDEQGHAEFVHTDGTRDDAPEPESCTPFCFDSCCSAHIICEVVFASDITRGFNNEEPDFHFSDALFPQRAASIWQPPKIQDLYLSNS